ncbi:MAG: hypothetical protein ACO3A2_11295 [Bdellovibrionia bacterium]
MNLLINTVVGYLKINRRWIAPVFLFPFFWKVLFLISPFQTSLDENFIKFKGLLFLLLLPLWVAQVFLSFGLAFTLKRKGSESWFSRLPIHDVVFCWIPYFLLLVHAFFIYGLASVEWNEFLEITGFPLVLILGVIPVVIFLTSRSIRNSSAGIFSALLLVGVLLGLADLIQKWAIGDLSSSPVGIGRFDQIWLRPILEFLGVGVVFGLGLLFERKKSLWVGFSFGMMASLLVSGALLFQLEQQRKALANYLSPLEKMVQDSYQDQAQCEEFQSFVQRVLGRQSQAPLRTRQDFLEAIQELKKYPIAVESFSGEAFGSESGLLRYGSNVPQGLAEGLVLKNLLSLYGCHVIDWYSLERSLIQTLVLKPFSLSPEELKLAEAEIWSTFSHQVGTERSLMGVLAHGEVLQLLSEKGLISDSHRPELMEFMNRLNQDRREWRRTDSSVAHLLRMPSQDRVHAMLASLQGELGLVNLFSGKLRELVKKIGQSRVNSGAHREVGRYK